ncbi:helix-turn-helix transcriptional regulator [Arenimonas sp.]|uniref:helix-turn-helix transcriptional regulator n=1 Tax=Arenimonas sp. TaxID=1872635 RepID=UPI002E32ED3A|nr:helix-turn-helix transcriptional regulator [Arenimonas sp.]HEX4854202.1 helix-turn-helix transcriptional regulator [Arenimonas sp.]
MPSTAERIRRARSLAGLSQVALAEAVGVRRSAVAQWERRDGCLPSMQHLIAIAGTTGVRLEWLGTGEGDWRKETGDWTEAVRREDFAQDDIEADCLAAIRRMPTPVRKQMLGVLKLVANNF